MTTPTIMSEALTSALFKSRHKLRDAGAIEKWIFDNIHHAENLPSHKPEQRRVFFSIEDWYFSHEQDKTKAQAALTVIIYGKASEESHDETEEKIFEQRVSLDFAFADWPFLSAHAVAVHVVCHDSPDTPYWLPMIDHVINNYAPIHFPHTSLRDLHALKDAGLLCIDEGSFQKREEVIISLMGNPLQSDSVALPVNIAQ